MGALTIAGRYIIPGMQVHFLELGACSFYSECCLYFNHTLFRGNRVSKTSSFDLSAFSSPNFPSLVDGMRRPSGVAIVSVSNSLAISRD